MVEVDANNLALHVLHETANKREVELPDGTAHIVLDVATSLSPTHHRRIDCAQLDVVLVAEELVVQHVRIRFSVQNVVLDFHHAVPSHHDGELVVLLDVRRVKRDLATEDVYS